MDDGDGAGVVEMMGGDPNAVLPLIYNGSVQCGGCGDIMNPVTAMYAGTLCPACTERKGDRRALTRGA